MRKTKSLNLKIPFPSFREPLLSEVQKGCNSLKLFRNRYQSPQKGENVVYKGFQRGSEVMIFNIYMRYELWYIVVVIL